MFRVGDTVLFGRPNGEKTRGRITKVNQKSYKITAMETRGTRGQYSSGGEWRVPKSLVWHDSPSLSNTYERPKRPELEILKEIDGIYAALSPENLHCDGEISHTAAMMKARGLNTKLKTLFRELGREVTEHECYQTIYHHGMRGRY